MHLLFIYGPVAAGKLTIARLVAQRTGMSLFHNHLVVDAVAAVFPFGSDAFIHLRERFWIETLSAAATAGTSLIFTFAPEPTVATDFANRAIRIVEAAGGNVILVALDVDPQDQERRLAAPSRRAFGKLKSAAVLRELRGSMDACMQAMPKPALRIDTSAMAPEQAARQIVRMLP